MSQGKRIRRDGSVFMNVIYFGLSYEALLSRLALLQMLLAPVEDERTYSSSLVALLSLGFLSTLPFENPFCSGADYAAAKIGFWLEVQLSKQAQLFFTAILFSLFNN